MLKFEENSWNLKNGEFEKIVSHRLTGAVFYDVLSADTCQRLVHSADLLKAEFYNNLNYDNGFSVPVMFGELHRSRPREMMDLYFSSIAGFCNRNSELFGADVAGYLHGILQSAFSPYNVQVLSGFLPYSIRVVFAGKEGLYLHRDAELLPYIHPEVGDRLSEIIDAGTMMSWFFTLQAPQIGGELWVADDRYFELEKSGPTQLKGKDGRIIDSEDELEHIKVKTPAGSLLMFKGGSYWHKVVPPAANCQSRVTLGGFMARSKKDENVILYWS